MDACRRCTEPLGVEALACPRCHALVYEHELERLRASALTLERDGQFHASLTDWRQMLHYLPPDTKQAAWVAGHLEEIGQLPDAHPETAPEPPGWARRLGPLAPIAIALFKGKGLLALFNLKSLVSLGAFMAVYVHLFGAAFGVGFAVLILVHEMGHYIDVRRRGLPAEMPIFLPGLGAYVRWKALGVTDDTRAAVSLAGPLAGLIGSIACAIVWWLTGAPIWAALARSSAWLNIMNLVPVWALDGGQAAGVLDRSERIALLSVALALWFLLGEGVFALVAGGAVWRLFTRDVPARPSRPIAVYFAGLLVALGVVMSLMPGQGAAIP